MPLLGLVLPLKVLVPAWTLIGMAAGTALLGSDRKQGRLGRGRQARARHARSASPSASMSSRCSTSATLAKWVGGFVLAYGLYSLWATFTARKSRTCRRASPRCVGGIGGGMTGTVVGTMGSMFFAMYFDAIGLAKDNYRATMTAILLTLTLMRGVGYFAVGEFSRDVCGRHRDAVSADAGRHLHRQPPPPRHERDGLPPHRGLRADRQRARSAHQIAKRGPAGRGPGQNRRFSASNRLPAGTYCALQHGEVRGLRSSGATRASRHRSMRSFSMSYLKQKLSLPAGEIRRARRRVRRCGRSGWSISSIHPRR